LTIRRVAIAAINPAPYNPRVALKPGDSEFESLRRSVDAFGCVEPLVWNKRTGNLVGGHQRLAVLRARGDTHADVSVVDLPLAREKALNLALNRIQGRWDEDRLAELLRELVELPEIELTGFGMDEAWGIVEGVLGEEGAEDGFDVDAAVAAAEAGESLAKADDDHRTPLPAKRHPPPAARGEGAEERRPPHPARGLATLSLGGERVPEKEGKSRTRLGEPAVAQRKRDELRREDPLPRLSSSTDSPRAPRHVASSTSLWRWCGSGCRW
jgi:hypothetical protein